MALELVLFLSFSYFLIAASAFIVGSEEFNNKYLALAVALLWPLAAAVFTVHVLFKLPFVLVETWKEMQ